MLRRFTKPFNCFRAVLFHAFSIDIATAKIVLSISIALVRSFPVPLCRSCFRLRHTPSILITKAKIVLRSCISIFCRLTVPFNCFCAVLFHAFSIVIAIAQIVLRTCHPLLCSFPVPFHSLRIVSCNTDTIVVADTQFVLRLRITLLCSLAVQLYSLCLVLADAVSGFIALAQFTLRFRAVLLSRFCIPLYSRHIVCECHIQPPDHILRCCISLSCRRFVPLAGLFFIFFNTERLIIAFAQCALRLRITLLGSFFIPHNGIFRILCYTNTVLIAPGHFKLCLGVSVFTGRNHVLLKRHLGIADLLKITGILQVVLLGFLLRFLLRFLTQTMVSHTLHKLLLFVLRAIELKAVHGIFLIAETHSLDLSPQTIPIHTASRRFKPFFNRFCLDGIRDFHILPTHTDRLQFICKTYFHLNFAHNDSLPMYL